MTRFILLALLLEMLGSCDPGFMVVLTNKSSNDKAVKVIDENKERVQFMDSISIADTGRGFFSNTTLRQPRAVKKTSENSYSFILEKGKEALLQNGIGGPDLNQKIIVNLNDTIFLNQDKRSVIKRKFMYTSVRVSVY
jgi:hypothetical protein